MLHWVRLSAVVLVAGLVAMMPACSKKNPGNVKVAKVAVVTNCSDPFWDLCEAGANKAAKEENVELLFRQPERLDAALQKPIIDSWVSSGVSGIAVSVIDPKGQTEDLKLVAGKVDLITMDNDAPDSKRKCYVGVDNRSAGRALGRLIKKILPNGGTLALFIGSTTSANGISRPGGLYEELATADANGVEATHPQRPNLKGKFYGKYFIVDGAPITDDGNKEAAMNNARDMLSRVEGINDICMVGLYAYNPPAILGAVQSRKLKNIKIVGFDEDRATLDAIMRGEIDGTVVQDPYQYGYQSVKILAALAKGDNSLVSDKPMPYKVVTKDGGPDEMIDGLKIEYPKAEDYKQKIVDAFKSLGK